MSQDIQRSRSVVKRLFTAFDVDGNNLVDHSELVSGLSMLCAGTEDDKIRAVFNLYGTSVSHLLP